jgi:hypothetical protein
VNAPRAHGFGRIVIERSPPQVRVEVAVAPTLRAYRLAILSLAMPLRTADMHLAWRWLEQCRREREAAARVAARAIPSAIPRGAVLVASWASEASR